MIPRYFILLLVVCLLVLAPGYVAAENGEVTIPLNQYAHLIDAAHAGHKSGLPQAAQFSLGRAVVKLETEQRNERLFGEMNVELAIKVVAKGWTCLLYTSDAADE